MVGKGGGGGRVMGVFASNSKICNLFLNTDIGRFHTYFQTLKFSMWILKTA